MLELSEVERIEREFERKLKREREKLKTKLEAVIERITSKNCWYDPWNRKGERADYGVLEGPVNKFIERSPVDDILKMVEFLKEKAERQIVHSSDEGDAEGQARYWVQKLLKVAVKRGENLFKLIDWAIEIEAKDAYLLTDAKAIVLSKNKLITLAEWDEIASHYKGVHEDIYFLALKKAGKEEELQRNRCIKAKRKGDYLLLANAALSRGNRAKAIQLCEQGIERSSKDVDALEELAARIEGLEGCYDRMLMLRMNKLKHASCLSDYVSLMDLARSMGCFTSIQKAAVVMLESEKKWCTLFNIALREYQLKEAIKYYWLMKGESSTPNRGYSPYQIDFDFVKSLSPVYPEEAIKVLQHIVQLELNAYTPEYSYVEYALADLKPLFELLGQTHRWKVELARLRTHYKRKRKLMEVLDRLD